MGDFLGIVGYLWVSSDDTDDTDDTDGAGRSVSSSRGLNGFFQKLSFSRYRSVQATKKPAEAGRG